MAASFNSLARMRSVRCSSASFLRFVILVAFYALLVSRIACLCVFSFASCSRTVYRAI
jgi:hypothetical protein